eukprot:1514463-Amphidinium_carterae.1
MVAGSGDSRMKSQDRRFPVVDSAAGAGNKLPTAGADAVDGCQVFLWRKIHDRFFSATFSKDYEQLSNLGTDTVFVLKFGDVLVEFTAEIRLQRACCIVTDLMCSSAMQE